MKSFFFVLTYLFLIQVLCASDSLSSIDTLYIDAIEEEVIQNPTPIEEEADWNNTADISVDWSSVSFISLVIILFVTLGTLFLSLLAVFFVFLLCSIGIIPKDVFELYSSKALDKGDYLFYYKVIILVYGIFTSVFFAFINSFLHWTNTTFALGWGAITGLIVGILVSISVITTHKHLSVWLKGKL